MEIKHGDILDANELAALAEEAAEVFQNEDNEYSLKERAEAENIMKALNEPLGSLGWGGYGDHDGENIGYAWRSIGDRNYAVIAASHAAKYTQYSHELPKLPEWVVINWEESAKHYLNDWVEVDIEGFSYLVDCSY